MIDDATVQRLLSSRYPIQIISADCEYGSIGIDGEMGYERLSVTNSLYFRHSLSAHANSKIQIEIHTSKKIRGFLNGTSDLSHGVDFFINGSFIGSAEMAYDATSVVTLKPGIHVLEVRHRGDLCNCHSVWGFNDVEDDCGEPKYNLAMAAVCQEAEVCLINWISHHISMGVEHFFILQCEAIQDLKSKLIEVELDQYVTLENPEWINECPHKSLIYKYIIGKFGKMCKWIGVFTTHDYIFPKYSKNLNIILAGYEEFGALRLQINQPISIDTEDGSINSDKKDIRVDKLDRYIAQPQYILEIESPNMMTFMPRREAVGENFTSDLSCVGIGLFNDVPNHKIDSEEVALNDPEYRLSSSVVQKVTLNLPFPEHKLERDEDHLAFDKLDAPKIVGFLHIAGVNHWKSVVKSQLKKAKISGLYDKTAEIVVGIVGASQTLVAEVEEISDKIRVIHCSSNLGNYEFPTLEALDQHCALHISDLVWYVHTKGTVNRWNHQKTWRSQMEQFIIIYHDIAIRKLKEGYEVAGHEGVPNHRWPIQGNFWWATARFIKSLPRISSLDQTDRWEAEAWIGMKGTEKMYWHASGDTILPEFSILRFTVGAGNITTNGFHSWIRVPIEVRKSWKYKYLVSAHAPTSITLDCKSSLKVFGFVSGTAERGDWKIEFRVDGENLGSYSKALDRTLEVEITPGIHVLEALVIEGDKWGAHTAWGIVENSNV